MTASNNIYNPPNSENKFYVYLHIDPRNNEVFYVGKGYNNRAWRIDKSVRSPIHFNKLNKILNLGYIKDDIVYVYKDNLNEQCAFCLERILISKYGRKDLNKGTLLNFTDGGEGTSGFTFTVSQKTKVKLSNYNKGKTLSKEHKRKISKSHKGKKLTQETKEKISKSKKEHYKIHNSHRKGKQHTEESKLKNSLSNCKYLYWYFDENGNKIEFINLKVYCEKHNHSRKGISYTIRNNKPYKGVQYYRCLLTEENQKLINEQA